MFDQECVPFAPSLIESMRSLGYSFSSAVADLIDNSISAEAKSIYIFSEPDDNPTLLIFDDGHGMTRKELYEAMRYGSSNPLEERGKNDLGRFGLGMKSASLSQCRKLLVISKKDNRISAYSWDLDYVIKTGKWILRGFNNSEIREFPQVELLRDLSNGTIVFLSDFDRIKEGTSDVAGTFNKCLNEMAEHLSLVFHRYLEENLNIYLNNSKIKKKDPFLSHHPATQRKRELPIYINNEKIILKPYILPHISKLKPKDLDTVGGKEELRNGQGFYVYRNKRLIVWGTWFRLEKKDELNKLARVRVDIPNTLDYMWSIDIKKSTAILPDIIKKSMYAAVYESVVTSEAVHTFRTGRRGKNTNDIDYVWERIKVREGYEYIINREIPQLKVLEETMDERQVKMLNSVLKTLEESFPVGALYVDAAKGNVEIKPITQDKEKIEDIWTELQKQIDYVKANSLSVADYYKAFSKLEPYCLYDEIKKRIQKELENYE